jgi:hypothetical protein
MLFDYKRTVQIDEIGLATGRSFLNLVGNMVGVKLKRVGHNLNKHIPGFLFTINDEFIYPGKRVISKPNYIYTDFVKDFRLENTVVRIRFDSDTGKIWRVPILIDIEAERMEFYKARKKEMDEKINSIFK